MPSANLEVTEIVHLGGGRQRAEVCSLDSRVSSRKKKRPSSLVLLNKTYPTNIKAIVIFLKTYKA